LRKVNKRVHSNYKDLRLTLYLIWSNNVSKTGVIILFFFLLISLLGPFIAPFDPYDVSMEMSKQPPGFPYIFGTDMLGRDIFSRMLHGAIISLASGSIIVISAAFIGTIIGLISGYYSKTFGQFLMRIPDFFMAFPVLVLAIALAVSFGPSFINSMIAIAISYWPRYARLVYGVTLEVVETDYVLFARTIRQSDTRIILKHVLPNTISPTIIQSSLDYGDAILFAAVLSFLGLGAQPPSPEWGSMVAQGRNYLFEFPWMSIIPGLTIFIVALGCNFLGDGVRDALDPNIRRMKIDV